MLFRQYPYLKRGLGGIRGYCYEIRIFSYNTDALHYILPYDIAEYTSLFVVIILKRAVQLLCNPLRDDRQGYKLGMGMLKRGASSLAMIFKYKDIAESRVFLQVYYSVSV